MSSSAPTYFISVGRTSVDNWMNSPTRSGASFADPGVLQPPGGGDEQDDRDGGQDERLGGHRDAEDLDALLAGELLIAAGRTPEEQQQGVAQCNRKADRHDHRGDEAGSAAAQWTPQQLVLTPAPQHRTEDDRDRCGDDDVQAQFVHDDRGECAERQQLAVSEVRQAGRAEDEIQPQRCERDEDAEEQAVGDELRHPGVPGRGSRVGRGALP